MTLRLYAVSGSPFAWRVHLALEHKRVPYELVTLSVSKGDTKSVEYLALNPRGKVPTIVDGDFVLWESAAILEYLEERFPDAPRLFPQDIRARAQVRRLVREIDAYVFPSQELLTREFFTKSEPGLRDTQAIARGRDGWLKELEWLEKHIAGDWLAGERVTAADFALYPFIATFPRFELRQPDLGLSAALGARLTAWRARMQALPYHDKTYPPHWRG